ncbi:MAG TPA: hypothetical protein VEW46_09620, partial [Pyrinomonadaceae bacterium]|nr:hypothetical protein [Pyrinomonadaceae bacterium]
MDNGRAEAVLAPAPEVLQPLMAMTRPAITYSYAIAGRSLCIKASDEWAAKLIQNFLRDFHLEPAVA